MIDRFFSIELKSTCSVKQIILEPVFSAVKQYSSIVDVPSIENLE